MDEISYKILRHFDGSYLGLGKGALWRKSMFVSKLWIVSALGVACLPPLQGPMSNVLHNTLAIKLHQTLIMMQGVPRKMTVGE